MDDSNDRRRPRAPRTHFDQVPLELVKKIARPDADDDDAAEQEGVVVKMEPYSVPPHRLKKPRG